MSIEQERDTRNSLKVGITGENVLPPLDTFTVIETDPLKIHDAMSEEVNEK